MSIGTGVIVAVTLHEVDCPPEYNDPQFLEGRQPQSKPIVLAININSNIKISNGKKALEVQDIRSIHDRTLIANNGTDLIQKWTQDGLCRYVDEKKITEWSNVARVYFPIDELNSAENKILTKSELVNSHTEVEQRNVALETSEERNMTELKTYHTLKEEDVKNLEIISDEDLYNDPQFLEGRQPENGKKKLNWTVFLALFAVFSSDERTLKMLDSMEVFQEGVAKEM